MNQLKGFITSIETADAISLIKVDVQGSIFSSIVIDTPLTNPWLREGYAVKLLFKETEVMIAKTFPLAISVQNKVACTIRKLTKGAILCEVELSIQGKGFDQGNDAGMIRSLITKNACEQLQLQEQDTVIALIKTNEVSLSAHD